MLAKQEANLKVAKFLGTVSEEDAFSVQQNTAPHCCDASGESINEEMPHPWNGLRCF